jgi:hypothetical protein
VGLLTRVNPQRGPIARQIRQQRVWAEKSREFNGLAYFGLTLCDMRAHVEQRVTADFPAFCLYQG